MSGQPRRAEPFPSQAFLAGCGLPSAWAGQSQWRVLETGFGLGLNFLATWQAWRDDPHRPRLLHFVSSEADVASNVALLRAASAHPELLPLAEELAAQWQGLLPGTHRLTFESGRVMLTLGMGDAQPWLKAQHLCVDSVYLNGFRTRCNPDIWDVHTFKAVARCCSRGTRLSSSTLARNVVDGLQQCGFTVSGSPGAQVESDLLQAVYDPPWEPRKKAEPAWPRPHPAKRCLVIGAGLAGAAAAASLARRGWAVTVLDAKFAPAGGASGLPAGFLAPHVSSDDGVLSRLSRSGLRATWQAVAELLQPGEWQAGGVLQRRLDASARLPADWPEAGAHWSQESDGGGLLNVDCEGDAQAPLWHATGGWVKPARLVEALLATPGVTCRYGQEIMSVQWHDADSTPVWQALDAERNSLAQAELVVIAAGPASAGLVASASIQAPPLQPVRGQVLWGAWPKAGNPENSSYAAAMPASPVNGLGGLIPLFPETINGESQPHWLLGATFERGEAKPVIRPEDTELLQSRLAQLWPSAAQALAPQIASGQAESWAGVRCGSPDRLPLVGPIDETAVPGLWLCTAMGSRGLTFAVLCGELLAAWANDEPLPLEKRLAQHLLASRFNKA